LILSVEGLDVRERRLEALQGPRLPAPVGPELGGQPGRLFAKLLKDEQGRSPAPFWKADLDLSDTRLRPGRPERITVTFPSDVKKVRVRLIHRRFWAEVEKVKGWPVSDLLVFTQMLEP
jgi:hypothetical protein